MSKIPKKYQFLNKEPAPKMLLEALRHYGALEMRGPKNSPSIMKWAKELVDKKIIPLHLYTSDSIAWCGLFMALISSRSGYEPPKDPLWALNWAHFGEYSPLGKLGYILVFKRFNDKGILIGGHVGLYVGENSDYFHVLGGNTGDSVSIARINKTRIFSIRRPPYKIGEPSNVRPIMIGNNGPISSNEV